MSDSTSFAFALVAEDARCRELAMVLADRTGSALLDDAWDLDPSLYKDQRAWRGRAASSPFSTRAEFPDPPKFGHGLAQLGWNKDPGAKFIAKVVYAFIDESIALLLIAMDQDRDRERAEAQRRARDVASRLVEFPVVLALMNPEAEAWEIAAFQPSSDNGRERHATITRSLTFDPVREPDRMTSTSGPPERDCKAVHRALLDGERPCHERPLTELLATAASTGLPAYLGDIHAALRAAFKLPDLPES